ncbi:phosphomethylpyrimidine synthase, partial [bacterium]
MTQLEYAKIGKITPLMKTISLQEGVSASYILKHIKDGRIVIPANRVRNLKKPCGIGFGLKTKINANIGTSTDYTDYKKELQKLKICHDYGADAVMDLSVGSGIKGMRKQIIRKSSIPVGTVPIYEISVNAHEQKKGFLKFDIDDICGVLESQAKDGVDFFTIHAGVTKKSLSA